MNDFLFSGENVFSEEDGLFEDTENEETEDPQDDNPETPEDKEKQPSTEEQINEDDLFDFEDEDDDIEDDPESVGEGKNKTGKGAKADNGSGSSPKGFNPYSSFAQALKGDGLFQSLDDDQLATINDADTFYEAFENEINSRVEEDTRRFKEAMEAGVSVDAFKQYKNRMDQLNAITDEDLADESEQGKNLRKAILMQDYMSRGFTKDRATREVQRIFTAGTDKEEVQDALDSVKEFFEEKYRGLVEQGKEAARAEREKAKEEMKQFKKAVLETEKVFGSIPVDKPTRQKAYDYMTKKVKTSEDGEDLTAVQLYADEHPVEFRTILGFVAALTDGFTKPSNLFNKAVDKKVRSNLREIEARVRGSQHRGGTISFAEGDDEPEQEPRRRFRLA